MSKKIKIAIIISSVVAILCIVAVLAFFIVRQLQTKETVENVIEVYANEPIQERIEKEKVTNTDELLLQIDGESVVGAIRIDKINFEGLIYEGTSSDILEKGVGHFENSPYLDGNVCLAAHNTNKFWAKLHTLQEGDKITYTSFLGTNEYKVNKIVQISETDWTLLKNTDENILTLITCVKGKPTQRLCIQALQVN